jgi:diguanylate cyclase
MSNPNDPWKDEKKALNDNPFNRRVNFIRQQTRWNVNEQEALDMLRNPAVHKNMFSPTEPVRELTDDEIDLRAFYDKETPTYNFRYLIRTIRREMVRSVRYKRNVSVLVVVVDNFVKIGQEFGMLAVDSTIAAASEALITSCRSDVDMVGRYAEDRFLVLLPETPGKGASVLAERIRKRFETISIPYQWHTIKVFASIGIAHYPGHGKDMESLIAQSELAAEIVIEQGGNGVGFAPNLESE